MKNISKYLLIFIILIIPEQSCADPIDVSVTQVFNLDKDGNGEIISITKMYFNKTSDWNENDILNIPILYDSYSLENFTVLNFSYNTYYERINNMPYKKTPQISPAGDVLYHNHYNTQYKIKYTNNLKENQNILNLLTKIKVNNLSHTSYDYRQFVMEKKDISNEGGSPNLTFKSFNIIVNLPNEPNYWSTLVDVSPRYNYRSISGRGETFEWNYNSLYNSTDFISLDYEIHRDVIKDDLDNATKISVEYAKRAEDLGKIAVIVGLIPIFWEIFKYLYSKIKLSTKETKEIKYKKDIENIIQELIKHKIK